MMLTRHDFDPFTPDSVSIRSLPVSSDSPLVRLLERCLAGEDDAWIAFVDRYHRVIARYAHRAARGVEDGGELAHELVQDVYVRLLEHDRRALRAWRGTDEASFLKYLAIITTSVACDKLRSQRSKKRSAVLVSLDAPVGEDGTGSVQDVVGDDGRSSPDTLYLERFEEERLNALLVKACEGTNGARNRLIFRLHAVEGFSPREIAEIPSIKSSPAAVETTLRRTRIRLRELIGSGDT